jgi:hypothetical protein
MAGKASVSGTLLGLGKDRYSISLDVLESYGFG